MRELVTIRTVSSIRPIPGADAIECATVDGWDVVVKRGEFNVGDPGVYFEIDSFLPTDDPRFAFLAKSGTRVFNGKTGVRLRTIKLRGQLSQGLLLPVNQFPEIRLTGDPDNAELASILGIEKWEAPIPAQLAGQVKGGFPVWIRKTDQERIQNLPHILADHATDMFEITVKLDGTSMTVYHFDGGVGVCSRNWEVLEDPSNTLWRVALRNNLPDALKGLGRNIALQGELIGPGIQGNPEKLKDQEFYIFDVFDIDQGVHFGYVDRQKIIDSLNAFGAQLKRVPVIDIATLEQFAGDIHQLLAFVDGPSLNATTREGLVFKRVDGRLSFKVVSNKYLLTAEPS